MNPRILSSARIKGSILIPVVKTLRSRRADSLAVLETKFQHYLDEIILAASWYPEADYAALNRAVGTLLGGRVPNVWHYLGVTGARTFGSTVYKSMIQAGDPRKTLQSFPTFWSLGHSTGRLVVIDDSDGLRMEMFDYPCASPEICAGIEGFHQEILVLAGATDARLAERACAARGATHCRWDVSFGAG